MDANDDDDGSVGDADHNHYIGLRYHGLLLQVAKRVLLEEKTSILLQMKA